jgi:hypothetical protein
VQASKWAVCPSSSVLSHHLARLQVNKAYYYCTQRHHQTCNQLPHFTHVLLLLHNQVIITRHHKYAGPANR